MSIRRIRIIIKLFSLFMLYSLWKLFLWCFLWYFTNIAHWSLTFCVLFQISWCQRGIWLIIRFCIKRTGCFFCCKPSRIFFLLLQLFFYFLVRWEIRLALFNSLLQEFIKVFTSRLFQDKRKSPGNWKNDKSFTPLWQIFKCVFSSVSFVVKIIVS